MAFLQNLIHYGLPDTKIVPVPQVPLNGTGFGTELVVLVVPEKILPILNRISNTDLVDLFSAGNGNHVTYLVRIFLVLRIQLQICPEVQVPWVSKCLCRLYLEDIEVTAQS